MSKCDEILLYLGQSLLLIITATFVSVNQSRVCPCVIAF